MEIALDAGADDVADDGDVFEVDHRAGRLRGGEGRRSRRPGIATASAEVAMVPQNTVSLTGTQAEQTLKLLEELEDHDDVQTSRRTSTSRRKSWSG